MLYRLQCRVKMSAGASVDVGGVESLTTTMCGTQQVTEYIVLNRICLIQEALLVVSFVLLLTAVVGVSCWAMNAYYARDFYGCYGADGHLREVRVVHGGILVERMHAARGEYMPSAPQDSECGSIC